MFISGNISAMWDSYAKENTSCWSCDQSVILTLDYIMIHFVKSVTQWYHSSAEKKAQKNTNWCSKRYMCEAPGTIEHLWAYIPSSFARSLLVCGKVAPPNQVGKSFWMTESFCKTHTVGCLHYYSARRQGMFSIVFIIVSVYALLHSGCALW